jgi:hypothetical protein
VKPKCIKTERSWITWPVKTTDMVANWVLGLPGKRDHGKRTRRDLRRGRCGDRKHPVPGIERGDRVGAER